MQKDFHLFLFFHLFFSGVGSETAWEAYAQALGLPPNEQVKKRLCGSFPFIRSTRDGGYASKRRILWYRSFTMKQEKKLIIGQFTRQVRGRELRQITVTLTEVKDALFRD